MKKFNNYLLSSFTLAILLNSAIFSQKVERTEFSGNNYFSGKAMLNMVALKDGVLYSENQLQLDANNIIKNYNLAGYLDAKIIKISQNYNFDSSTVDLEFNIQEGTQTEIGEILFNGNKLLSTASIKKIIETKPGDILDLQVLNSDITNLLNYYETNGYPFASVTVENIETYKTSGNKKLRIKIIIDENDIIKINRIVVEGNTTTNDNVIKREINLGREKTVTSEMLSEIKSRLENLGYFETVEQPKILKYKNESVMLLKVKEGNTNTFDGILGYVPPAANEQSGYITGIANISLKNLFGTGRKLEARYEKDVRTTQELELKYLEPWFLDFPVHINLGFLQRVEDTLYVKRNIDVKTDVAITQSFYVSALFTAERVIPTANTNSVIIFNSRLLSTGIELKYDSRDYIYNPFKGILLKSSYTVGQKKIYNAVDYPSLNLRSDFTVQKASFEAELYSSFFRRQSALISFHGFEISSPQFEISDFFRFGGTRSVRGYREGQFLGSRVIWNNNELRYSLTRKSFAVALFDMGYYWRPADDLALVPKQEGFIFGYGLGIRIETSLGIFGVSYALGRGDTILEGKVHFGFVNDF